LCPIHYVCEDSSQPGLAAKERRCPVAIDPVCKMQVEESKAAATSEYKGKKYYFCAAGCKKAFDQDPEKYLAKGSN
jgi:YHS domain-containing protein